MKILLTSGATREPIDGVRYLSNFSTGATGKRLAERWASRGHTVAMLAGEGAEVPSSGVEVTRFGTFQSLDSTLRARLGEERWDSVVHLAAASDYSVEWIDRGEGQFAPDPGKKLDSSPREMTIGLRRNFKIVERLREYASAGSPERDPVLVAFKLTQGAGEEERELKVADLFGGGSVDWVIHNDLTRWSSESRGFRIYEAKQGFVGPAGTVEELADRLIDLWKERGA